jgi:hypothetical protein
LQLHLFGSLSPQGYNHFCFPFSSRSFVFGANFYFSTTCFSSH